MISSDWGTKPVVKCARIVSGGTPSKARSDYWDGDVPWITAKDMKTFRLDDSEDHLTLEGTQGGTRVAPAGSTLVLVRGMTLHQKVPIGFATRDLAFNQDVKALIPLEGVDPRFLAYALLAKHDELLGLVDAASHGTGRLNTDALANTEIQMPSLDEQHRVASAVGSLDDKIDLNRRMGETLEEIARALFTSWFVDFDPVRGTATVPEDVRRLFPDRLVDSAIGPVPEGWEVAPLGEHVEVTRGLSYTGAGLADEGMPLHNLNSIREGGGYKEGGIKHYLGEYRERDRVRPGDLIVANTDLTQNARVIGYPAIVPCSFGDDGLYSQDLCRLRPLEPSALTPRYLYLLLASHGMRHQVASYSNGTTVLHLAKDGLTRPLIAVPPGAVVKRFDAIVAPMFDQQEASTAESKTLAELRDTLLPKLISGEMTIRGNGGVDV